MKTEQKFCNVCEGFLDRNGETESEPICKDNWCTCEGFKIPDKKEIKLNFTPQSTEKYPRYFEVREFDGSGLKSHFFLTEELVKRFDKFMNEVVDEMGYI